MNSASAPRRRRGALSAAALSMIGLPVTAFLIAPAAGASTGGGAPGSQLAGINTSAAAAAVQITPYTPGVVGAGNVTQGNLVEAALPFASSTVSTGPATGGVASPVYPGPTAAGAGTALQTFAPQLPAALVGMLNDPVLAQSAYPPQVHTGSSGSYQAPGASVVGAGTADTQSGPASTMATAALSDTSLLGGAPIIRVGSATSATTATVQAASVTTTAEAELSHISIAGVVQIAGIASQATSSSDGTTGREISSLRVAEVTVLGQPAYIGPGGLHLAGSDQGAVAVALFNSGLQALRQAGITITAVAPAQQHNGAAASVTSGAVQISSPSVAIPNPQGRLPVPNSVRLDIDLGLSQASADATALPPFVPFPSTGTPTPAAAPPAASPSSAGAPATGVPAGTGAASVAASPVPAFGSPASGAASAPAGPAPSPAAVPFVPELAGFLGLPVRAAWVVAAFLLSLVAAGPLLAYANWQLLRGRRS